MMGKLYRCTESDEILTEAQLQAEFETLKAEEPETYDYNFTDYIKNCTSKNGFLEVLKMFEVKNGNRIHYFTKKADADIYSDFLLNGLKVIRREGKTIFFNDFSRLFNVSLPNEKPERFILRKSDNRTVTDKRQIKKYLLAAGL